MSKIEWTDETWNPVSGCDHISEGCKNCWAETMAYRLQKMENQPSYKNGFALTLQWHQIDKPLDWIKPKKIFVCSMSDLFHHAIPLDYLKRIFYVMNHCSHHTFQILTKRPENMLKLSSFLKWTDNIWVGVSVESKRYLHRIDTLRKIPSKIKFVSFEPLIGAVEAVNFKSIDLAIVGAETGAKARPMQSEWVDSIFQQCVCKNVPFFFKSWGTNKPLKERHLYNGQTFHQLPKVKS
ncbi:MAG: phage Gp37/Gp68 family protein [Candidatus Bathyarchaeia archaeon]